MPVTVLYISQELRTKALKPNRLVLPHGLATKKKKQVLLCFSQKMNFPVEKKVAMQESLATM